MFQTTNHIRLNPPRVEGTRFRFRWWLQILNRFFPKANLKILGHTHMLEKKSLLAVAEKRKPRKPCSSRFCLWDILCFFDHWNNSFPQNWKAD
jgi:hypothetical protein